MNILGIIGLGVNVLGAIMLTISSRRVSKAMSTMLQYMSKDYGTWNMGKMPDNQVTELNNSINNNKTFSLVGWILFILGFCIRIISLLEPA